MLLINEKPSFLITIDTEGDNLWAKPTKITTLNADFLPRFQMLCEKYKFKPTYLTSYEMAKSSVFQEFGKEVIKKGKAEIGMHLHAWNSPPYYKLTANDYKYQPYLIEYPEKIMKKKISYLTKLLEELFKTKIYSHRAGRWCFNELYAQILIENGYCVDCSVTPLINWEIRKGGKNYYYFPNNSYFIDENCISINGKSSLLEVPVSIFQNKGFIYYIKNFLNFYKPIKRVLDNIFPTAIWFRPSNKYKNKYILKIVEYVLKSEIDYIELVLHSSELMPGGSPNFKNKKDIELLYKNLDFIFKATSKFFIGRTLKEYYDIKIKG